MATTSLDVTNSHITLYAALTVSGLALFQHYRNATKNKLRHPPSPKSFPIIGNLFSIPPGVDHEAYMELGKQLNSELMSLLHLYVHLLIIMPFYHLQAI